MFFISVLLSVGLTTILASPYFPNLNGGNPRFVPQQEPSTTHGDQAYAPNMPQLSMEGNQPIYLMSQQPMMQSPMMQPPMMQPPMMQSPMMQPPMMQPPMMQPPMMQGFQPPFGLSLLAMLMYAKMMALLQLMSMQNRYQLYQPNQYNPAVNNYAPTPAPLPYVQQPQVDLQNNFQNEMLQQQRQAESQQRAILEKRRAQREFDLEIERRERLIKIKAEQDELEKQQKEVERLSRDQAEIKREREEAEKQILEEERKEMEQKKKDLQLRQQEERRFKRIEEEKKKQNQGNMKPKVSAVEKPRNVSVTKKENIIVNP